MPQLAAAALAVTAILAALGGVHLFSVDQARRYQRLAPAVPPPTAEPSPPRPQRPTL